MTLHAPVSISGQSIRLNTREFAIELTLHTINVLDAVQGHIKMTSHSGKRKLERPIEVMLRFPNTIQFMGTRIHLSLVELKEEIQLIISMPTKNKRRWRGVIKRWPPPTEYTAVQGAQPARI